MTVALSNLRIEVAPEAAEAGRRAAEHGARLIREAIAARGQAVIIVATGASQFHMLAALVTEPGVAWEKVTVFHLDEYLGLPVTHPASFRLFLWERFHSKLPVPVRAFYYLNGEADDPLEECGRVGRFLAAERVDVAFIGIGENAHLAFNDPPADFETEQPYLVVALDEACRRQQLGEGWFPSLEAVPTRALSMSVRQILKSRNLVVTVPDARKAHAVHDALEGPLTPMVPASILRTHPACFLFLDPHSASQLTPPRP